MRREIVVLADRELRLRCRIALLVNSLPLSLTIIFDTSIRAPLPQARDTVAEHRGYHFEPRFTCVTGN